MSTTKEIVGDRIEKARNGKNWSRPKLADELQKSELSPETSKNANLVQRIKKWEYGENGVPIEWISALCKVLDCDAGYLFGEYEEKHKEAHDICALTGLSEKAVDVLIRKNKMLQRNKNIAQIYSLDGQELTAINYLISENSSIFANVYDYLFASYKTFSVNTENNEILMVPEVSLQNDSRDGAGGASVVDVSQMHSVFLLNIQNELAKHKAILDKERGK